MKSTRPVILFYIFASLLWICPLFSAQAEEKRNDEMLSKLDQALNMSNTYDSYFDSRIESLRTMLIEEKNLTKITKINFMIASEFSHVCLDSTLCYVDRNMELAKRYKLEDLRTWSDLCRAYFYALAGYYIEAGEIIRSYNPDTLDKKSFLAYHRAARKFYYELSVYSPNSANTKELARNSRLQLLKETPEDSYEWHDLLREEAFLNGNFEQEQFHALQMLQLVNEGTNAYATACYYYSTTFPEDSDDALYWLINSSISDVLSGTKDYQSLITVAEILFHRGDIVRAFSYLAGHSLPDAILYNGKLRPLQISKLLPAVEGAYQGKLKHEEHVKNIYLCALFIFIMLLCLMMYNINNRNKILTVTRNKLEDSKNEIESQNVKLLQMNHQLKALNAKMKESDKVKEEYISLFLSILSDNISTTRKYKNHVLRNLRKGNYKGLVEEIEMLPPIDEDINEFYRMFDQTFTNMYPDFVERFNQLLQPGEAILPKGGDLLTPDHRIFALIKLGISDSSKIAALLHYSTNTIYNYKARIKNKALGDREKFEEKVKNLYSSSSSM